MVDEKIVADVFSQIPKKAPPWAVGIATVILSVATSVITVYLFSHEDIKKYVGWVQQSHDSSVNNKIRQETETLPRVLSLIQSNQEQIVTLSQALGQTQQQNVSLNDRVSTLERSLNSIQSELLRCESDLKLCRKKD